VSRPPVVVVGDLLLDREVLGSVDRLCPEAPVPVLKETSVLDRPGGAGLAAVLAAGDREVVLVAAVSADEAGDRLREIVAAAGVRLVALPLDGPTPEKIRLRAGAHLLLRLDRGDDAPATIGRAPADALVALHAAGAILVSDYGRGITAQPQVRMALAERAHRAPVVWDPHPKGEQPVAAARLVTPNGTEAAGFTRGNVHSGEWPLTAALRLDRPPSPDGGHAAHGANGMNAHGANGVNGHGPNGNGHRKPADRELAAAAGNAVRLRRLWSAGAVVVTMADRGAVLSDGVRPPLLVPAPFPAHGDSCGAGDRFAATAVTAFAGGADMLDAVTAAVASATAYVAAGGALALHRRADVAAPVRAARTEEARHG